MSSPVTVTWVEKEQFIGIDTKNHSIVLSSQNEENGTGSKPSDVMLIALGACAGVDLIGILQKQRQRVNDLKILVSGEQLPDPPWTFTSIHMEVIIRGVKLSATAVERAIELAVNKYCSVASTICATAPVTTGYKLIEE